MLEFEDFRGYDQHDFDGWDLFTRWVRSCSSAFKILEDAAGACGYEMYPPGPAEAANKGAEGGGGALLQQRRPRSISTCHGQGKAYDKKNRKKRAIPPISFERY